MPRSKKIAAPKRKVKASAESKQPKRTTSKSKKPVTQQSAKSAGASRAAGIKLFNLAGRSTREQFILVYGQSGPTMTWTERAKAGVSAKQFQAALAAKQAGR